MMTEPTHNAKLFTLNEIGALLDESEDIVASLNQVVDLVVDLTGADRGYLLLFKEELETHQVVAARSAGGTAGGDIIEPGRFLIESALATGHTIASDDMPNDERLKHLSSDDNWPLSVLIVPAQTHGQVLGIVCVDSWQSNAFSAADTQLLEIVAGQVALAIENDRLLLAVQDATKAKNEYVSLVTHELRVPLTSITGYTDMILNGMVGPVSDKQLEFLQTVKRNVDRMSELILALSDINRIESGRFKLVMTDFELSLVVDEVVQEVMGLIQPREQRFIIEEAPEMPTVHADRDSIRRVMTNLISNASQYTQDGGAITLNVKVKDDFVVISITDTGIGISEEDQDQLFTPFFRSEHEMVRKQVGWGLGLALSKKLIEIQGGGIYFNSQVDQGSTFSFMIPLTSGGTNQP